ncbi:MAG: AAA family ATPase [Hyphomicrobiaceae bacterium]
MSTAIYAFGPFRLDAEAETLFRDGEPLPLGKRAVALLCALVQRAGTPVSRDALLEAAWPRLIVEESNLAVQIAAVRKMLGQEPGCEGWIETLPRRGYRFIGPVRTAGAVATAPASHEATEVGQTQPDSLLPPAQFEPERRQLTTAFCELVCPSAAALDPEDLRDVITAYQRSVASIINACSGSIGKSFGNTMVAYFGYPTAHEDDADQAIRAALTIVVAGKALAGSLGRALGVRIGIATGLVIIDDVVSVGERQEMDVVGAATTIAGRLVGAAELDTVVIDETTRHLIGNLFRCRELDTDERDGKARGWQILGVSRVESRFAALRGGNRTPLVGRDEELDLLRRRWTQACAGEGRVVLLAGEAGIGKSRITLALQELVQNEPHTLLRFFCSPHHTRSALYPAISQLERAAGFEPADSTAAKFAKLEALLEPTATSAQDVALIADLLSLASDRPSPAIAASPQQQREMTLAALLRQLERLAAQRPVLVLYEDAHWVDPTSLDLLDRVVARVAGLSVLLVISFRPELQPTWVGQPHVTFLPLSRLGRHASAGVIAGITKGKALPAIALEEILARADGVPLFIEELTSSLLEAGQMREASDRYVLEGALAPLAVPTTLQALLVARLDRLGSAKNIAQIGAAIGREFSHSLIASVAALSDANLDAALQQLITSGLISARGMPPEATYTFKHALVQDAAYATFLKGRRQQLHADIAHALEDQFPALVQSQPEIVAHHYTNAGLDLRAIHFWLRAGQLANDKSANDEAVSHLSRGLELLSALPAGRERDELELKLQSTVAPALVATKGYGAGETLAAYERARMLTHATRRYSAQPAVLSGLYAVYVTLANYEKALGVGNECLAAARERDDTAHLCIGNKMLAVSHDLAGNFQLAQHHGEQAWALYDREHHGPLAWRYAQDIGVAAGSWLAIALAHLGFFESSATSIREVLELAERLDHHNTVGYAHCCGGAIPAFFMHDFTALRHHAERMQMQGHQHAMPQWVSWGACLEAPALAAGRERKRAIKQMEAGLALRARINNKHSTRLIFTCAAEVHLGAGRASDALDLVSKLLQPADVSYERWTDADLWRLKGDALLASKGKRASAEAHACYEHALSIAKDQGSRLLQLRAATRLARLMSDTGRRDGAIEVLEPICAWFADASCSADLREAKALVGELR